MKTSKMTSRTSENVAVIRSGHRTQIRPGFTTHPTTGALEASHAHRVKVLRALNSEMRRLKFMLYLSLPRLYLAKLSLAIQYSALRVKRDLQRTSNKLFGDFHDFGPKS